VAAAAPEARASEMNSITSSSVFLMGFSDLAFGFSMFVAGVSNSRGQKTYFLPRPRGRKGIFTESGGFQS
jgi:hypothetical protein